MCVQQIMAHMAYAQYLSALSSVIKMHTTNTHTHSNNNCSLAQGRPSGSKSQRDREREEEREWVAPSRSPHLCAAVVSALISLNMQITCTTNNTRSARPRPGSALLTLKQIAAAWFALQFKLLLWPWHAMLAP